MYKIVYSCHFIAFISSPESSRESRLSHLCSKLVMSSSYHCPSSGVSAIVSLFILLSFSLQHTKTHSCSPDHSSRHNSSFSLVVMWEIMSINHFWLEDNPWTSLVTSVEPYCIGNVSQTCPSAHWRQHTLPKVEHCVLSLLATWFPGPRWLGKLPHDIRSRIHWASVFWVVIIMCSMGPDIFWAVDTL